MSFFTHMDYLLIFKIIFAGILRRSPHCWFIRRSSWLALRANSLKRGAILSSFQVILEEETSITKKEESIDDSHTDET